MPNIELVGIHPITAQLTKIAIRNLLKTRTDKSEDAIFTIHNETIVESVTKPECKMPYIRVMSTAPEDCEKIAKLINEELHLDVEFQLLTAFFEGFT